MKRLHTALYIALSLTFFAGLTLSALSWLEVCTTQCSDAHHYQFFGLSFGMIGMLFFSTLIVLHFLSIHWPFLTIPAGFMIAGGLGAEIMLVVVQKFVIGKWCPICLSIAGMIALSAVCYIAMYLIDLDKVIKINQRDKIMKNIWKGVSSITIFAIGFLVTFFGIGKEDKLQAVQSAIEQNLVFGNSKSSVIVYIFTDWQCPACRQAEPAIEKMFPILLQNVQVVFVDLAIHPESLNFIPYNLSFILRNKPQYMQLRHMLTNISTQTDSPSEEQVEDAASKLGIQYKQLNYSDIVLGIRYFRRLVQEYNVQGTPTVLVVNSARNLKKRFNGSDAITEENILKAIQSMNRS